MILYKETNIKMKYFALLFVSIIFAVNAAGFLYADGIITTIAGNATVGYSGDGGPATSAQLYWPTGMAIDRIGDVYIADEGNNRVRKVSADGIISTVAGNGTPGYAGDGGIATSASLHAPTGVALDNSGNIYIADSLNHCIRKVSTEGLISTIAGNGSIGLSGDGGLATSAQLNTPSGVALDNSGNVYVADQNNNRIRKINTSGIISTVAGISSGYAGDGYDATFALINGPYGIALDSSGNLYIADENNNRIRRVNTSGIISTIAGDGTPGFSGDGFASTSAQLYLPTGVAVDAPGNVYISDSINSRIRKIDASGIITTVAGNGVQGWAGDGGSATDAELYGPYGVSLDILGNIYIADYGNNIVRKVILVQTGTILGKITGSNGTTPVPGATVNILQSGVMKSSTTTDTNGNYAVSVVTGTYDISASCAKYHSQVKTSYEVLSSSAVKVNFALEEVIQTGIVSGKVAKSDGTTAIPGVLVEAVKSNTVKSSSTTGTGGNYGFAVTTGTCDIRTTLNGYQPQVKSGYNVTNGSTITVNFALIEVFLTKQGKQTTLSNNLFNPANGNTCKIEFIVMQPGNVTIKICDLMGRQLKIALDSMYYNVGKYQWNWDGKDDSGAIVPPGVYILYYKYPGGAETRKIGVE